MPAPNTLCRDTPAASRPCSQSQLVAWHLWGTAAGPPDHFLRRWQGQRGPHSTHGSGCSSHITAPNPGGRRAPGRLAACYLPLLWLRHPWDHWDPGCPHTRWPPGTVPGRVGSREWQEADGQSSDGDGRECADATLPRGTGTTGHRRVAEGTGSPGCSHPPATAPVRAGTR